LRPSPFPLLGERVLGPDPKEKGEGGARYVKDMNMGVILFTFLLNMYGGDVGFTLKRGKKCAKFLEGQGHGPNSAFKSKNSYIVLMI
jgi:hypothetical protein